MAGLRLRELSPATRGNSEAWITELRVKFFIIFVLLTLNKGSDLRVIFGDERTMMMQKVGARGITF